MEYSDKSRRTMSQALQSDELSPEARAFLTPDRPLAGTQPPAPRRPRAVRVTAARPPMTADGAGLEADRATQGGATLKILHGKPWVHDRIRAGGYAAVILQEDIPELTEHSVAPFFEYGRRFDREIREAGGQAVLFMAWPYARLNWVSLAQIAQAHRDLGKELGVPVAPVGLAFERALKQRPDLPILGRDREHETIPGTYLAASVIYATLFGESPQGFKYCPAGVSAEAAAFLQRVAWETVQAWQRQ